jgi:hypothetical protein
MSGRPEEIMKTGQREAVRRLLAVACRDTGQSRRVANFLLAWHNAAENGGWDPTDLWGVDDEIARDMLTVLELARSSGRYPSDLGFKNEIEIVWRLWRAPATADNITPL